MITTVRNAIVGLLIAATAAVAVAEEKPNDARGGLARIANGGLELGVARSSGTLCELVQRSDSSNRLVGREEPFALWEITITEGDAARTLAADRAGPPHIEPLAGREAGLRLVWSDLAAPGKEPLRVEVEVRLDDEGASDSHWTMAIAKPRDVRLKKIGFPRVPRLRPYAKEALAVPVAMGALTHVPRELLRGPDGRGKRLAWNYPGLSLQCLAYYEPDGPGFYAACDDRQAYHKSFVLWGDKKGDVHFEMVHQPEEEAVGRGEFHLPYAVILGAFRGDWTTAAERYRVSPAARAMAAKGRLGRGLTPDWVRQTGLWVWNRGRSGDVLPPAAELQRHLNVPVSVLWHWWHDCAYDVGFPEYLPPREGAEPFRTAVEAAHRQGLHILPYMNQRLWGMTTSSWTAEKAETFAVKLPDGKTRIERFNRFMDGPCAAMCMGTAFWRDKYAGIAQEVLCDLKADGIYMDQACIASTCFDPRHGHILGPGRYWTDGFSLLAQGLRERCATQRSPIVLAGEHCGEPWLSDLDLMLNLQVSEERFMGQRPWEVIPFFHAVYHSSIACFGNYSSLVYPPYDERWPPEKAPATRLALLDRKFVRQYRLEHARTFVWGQQPMLANFFSNQLSDRPEEIDYLARLVRTRLRGLKYLLDGDWLRPPVLDVPQREIDTIRVGVYAPSSESSRQRPTALAGAWRAPDGDVAIALASIDEEPLRLDVPIDVKGYALGNRRCVYRIDANGRHRVGSLDPSKPVLQVELPPLACWLLEFCAQ